jgi:hypothetical protein
MKLHTIAHIPGEVRVCVVPSVIPTRPALAVCDLTANRTAVRVGFDTQEKRAELMRRYGIPMPLATVTPAKYDRNYVGPVDSREAYL